jgi:hypothetical protein
MTNSEVLADLECSIEETHGLLEGRRAGRDGESDRSVPLLRQPVRFVP